MMIDGNTAVVNGTRYAVDVKEGMEPPQVAEHRAQGEQLPAAAPSGIAAAEATPIRAPMPGSIVRIVVQQGDPVKAGDTLVVLEAMKMETDVKSPADGTVASIEVSAGDTVTSGQVILRIG